MAEHTAGPWTYDFSSSNGPVPEFMVTAPDIAVVAHVWADEERGISGGIVEANARLIAAAPRMADMLGRVYRALVAYEAGDYLDGSSLFVAIGDVLSEAGITKFGVEP